MQQLPDDATFSKAREICGNWANLVNYAIRLQVKFETYPDKRMEIVSPSTLRKFLWSVIVHNTEGATPDFREKLLEFIMSGLVICYLKSKSFDPSKHVNAAGILSNNIYEGSSDLHMDDGAEKVYYSKHESQFFGWLNDHDSEGIYENFDISTVAKVIGYIQYSLIFKLGQQQQQYLMSQQQQQQYYLMLQQQQRRKYLMLQQQPMPWPSELTKLTELPELPELPEHHQN